MITHIDLEIHSPETLWSWSFTHMFNRITHFKPSPGIAISTGIRLGSLWHRRPSKFGKLLLIRTVCELWSINAFTMEGKQFSGPSTVQDHHKWGTVKGAMSFGDTISTSGMVLWVYMGTATATAKFVHAQNLKTFLDKDWSPLSEICSKQYLRTLD